jgi:hypothetical protein
MPAEGVSCEVVGSGSTNSSRDTGESHRTFLLEGTRAVCWSDLFSVCLIGTTSTSFFTVLCESTWIECKQDNSQLMVF